jgi:hypothetical protein
MIRRGISLMPVDLFKIVFLFSGEFRRAIRTFVLFAILTLPVRKLVSNVVNLVSNFELTRMNGTDAGKHRISNRVSITLAARQT